MPLTLHFFKQVLARLLNFSKSDTHDPYFSSFWALFETLDSVELWSDVFLATDECTVCIAFIHLTFSSFVSRSPRAHSCGPCSHQPFFVSVEQGEAPPPPLLHPASICHIHRPGPRRPGEATKRGRHKDRHLHAGQRFAICQPGTTFNCGIVFWRAAVYFFDSIIL